MHDQTQSGAQVAGKMCVIRERDESAETLGGSNH